MSTTAPSPTYYDILGVSRNADAATVRKSYLRASLRCHPDKNPGREEESKAEFIQVGQAYAVLSDPAKRREYDRGLDREYFRPTKGSSSRPSAPRPTSQQQQQQRQEQQFSAGGYDVNNNNRKAATNQDEFDTFMHMFDETVSGMSEDELNMAIGAAAVVGGIIGSIIGARAVKGHNSLLANAASMVGSAMASQAASKLVQTVHDDSKQRMLERGEREAAIARGETVQGLSSNVCKERVLQDAGRTLQKIASAALGGCSGGVSGSSSGKRCSGKDESSTNAVQQKVSWRQAAEVVKMALDVCSDMQHCQGGANSKQFQSRTNR